MHLADSPPPQPRPTPLADLRPAIRRRAEEIYLCSGGIPGRDLDNWAQAEKEILAEFSRHRRAAIVIHLRGVQYIGEYRPEAADGYFPGEFSPGSSLPVRFEGDRMFVRRPNGKELETTVVQTIG